MPQVMRPGAVLASMLFLAGCTWLSDDDWQTRTDRDQDGSPVWEDCDDADASRNAGEPDVCDGLDNDCSGVPDDDPAHYSTWYLDLDQDGYGDAAQSTSGCVAAAAYVDNGDDCDDNDALLSPDAVEVCDGLDQDCDGEVDEDPIDPATWYADQDNDGYGADDTALLSCDCPEQYVADPGDCDDLDGATYPGASEVCDDGIDSDCDGSWSGCGIELANAGLVLQGAGADHSAGLALAVAQDLNGDSAPDLLVGAPGADLSGVEGGAAYIIFGPITAGERSLSASDGRVASADAGQTAGSSVGSVSDIDGDGYPELLLGAPKVYEDTTKEERGSVYLLTGPHGGDRRADTDAVFELRGRRNYDHLGSTLLSADLVGADGVPDLAVVAWSGGGDIAGDNPGAVYLVDLSVPPTGLEVVTDISAATVEGADNDDNLGNAVAAGDIDGDGVDDLMVSAAAESSGGTEAGSVYVLKGPLAGAISASDADLTRRGLGGDHAGESLSHCDYDGDGHQDLLAGATDGGGAESGIDEPGAVWLITDFDATYSTLADDAELKVVGDAVDQELGSAVDCGGDADGDGAADLLLGAWRWPGDGDVDGAALVFLGAADRLGTLSAAEADATLAGPTGSSAGVNVAWMDLDGLGKTEALVGAPDDDGAAEGAGAVYGLLTLGL